MKMNRWIMNRAGILNFWFYTDEVFELSDGRIIFRGANGSGKSVTMQSFVPLVLDGDKRASRLDPFGSKDRKIEYYLLGEAESGINDRTGYLWLEFAQPSSEKYVTVGIGLRARRGAAQVGFWGFSVTDGRRIGRDLFLYDEDAMQKFGSKIPLDRAELEQVIGSGGRVVREQREYEQMVNQLLFGFADIGAYNDLLELLIQLRSPKLSKEFKPSTIYGILNEALPPLSDEELRPLAEVLEDMDEIGDRLDELRLHLGEAQRLASVYGQYNEQRLYELSAAAADDAAEREKLRAEVEAQEKRLAEVTEQIRWANESLAQTDAQLLAKETELDVLNRSEAMEKLRELQTVEERLRDVREQLAQQEARLALVRKEQGVKTRRADGLRREAERHAEEQRRLIEEMETQAADVEFRDHGIYRRQWESAGSREEAESSWPSWRRDVAAYRKRLKEASELCEEEREQAAGAQAAELRMSTAREERDAAERERGRKEEALRQAVAAQEDTLFQWYRGLQRLPLSEEGWREMARRLAGYPRESYETIIEPVKQAADTALGDVAARTHRTEHDLRLKEEEKARLEQELMQWRMHREPEPLRSQARLEARRRRLQESAGGGGAGAPLYACCEFLPSVDERTRAMLESALHTAGLLDAWIDGGDKGISMQLAQGEEEQWIVPAPIALGITLADYLEPHPPEGSGLSRQQIDDVLRTIRLSDGDFGLIGASGFVTAEGQFMLGPLAGQASGKSSAEWIGAEARKQSRLREIERLEQAVAAVEGEIGTLQEQLRILADEAADVRRERDSVPEEEPLRAANRELQLSDAQLEHARKVESAASDAYKEALRLWRELQRRLLELTSAWSRLKKLADFREALDLLQEYEQTGLELKSALAIGSQVERELGQLEDDLSSLEEQLESEEDAARETRSRERQFQAASESLRRIVQEMGVYDLHMQITELKEAIQQLKRGREEWHGRLLQLSGEKGSAEAKLGQAREELAEGLEKAARSERRLQQEWNLRLVDFGESALQDAVADDSEALLQLARQIRALFRSKYENRRKDQLAGQLQETFALAKNTLIDYSLEQRYDEATDRFYVESVRDRTRPFTPGLLLAELVRLEEEQRLLIEEKDRELYEQVLIHSVGRAIKDKINRAEQWVDEMNRFMESRHTSSGLVLSLEWRPKPARSERELDTERLVRLLRKNPNALLAEEIEQMIEHFRSRIRWAKEDAQEGDSLRKWIQELLDYRSWFSFTLYYRKGSQQRRELTDSRFNVLSGGEKAMAMYIPLFAATDSRYKDSRDTAPRIISLDEAFAGVDDENMKDMFQLLTEMQFDYMMTSQVLWGCYETVPSLSIYEIYRPQDVDFVTLFVYYWNGHQRRFVEDGDLSAAKEVAVASER